VTARRGARRLAWLLCAVLALAAGPARAQRSTEQFIPIGLSPGISQKQTAICTVDSMNLRDLMVTVSESGVRRIVRLTPRTHVWLDRSKLKLPNLEGGPGDLQPGRRIEIKFENPVLRRVADWVKVEITQPQSP
jgi:hypothetical protein